MGLYNKSFKSRQRKTLPRKLHLSRRLLRAVATIECSCFVLYINDINCYLDGSLIEFILICPSYS
uniref:MADS-box domain-containing protein n=1 Tax=Heterorhabditis bacteriophora TaxID=37862 RepID=A0A1I7X5U9_HETBA